MSTKQKDLYVHVSNFNNFTFHNAVANASCRLCVRFHFGIIKSWWWQMSAQPLYKKPFSKADFAANDSIAREIAKKIYKEIHRVDLHDNEDLYGVDLLGPNGVAVECEVRNSWKTGLFKFEDFTFPVRKLKYEFFDLVTINNDKTFAVIVSGETIFKYKNNLVQRSNRFSGSMQEEFVCIPVSEILQIDLRKLKVTGELHE